MCEPPHPARPVGRPQDAVRAAGTNLPQGTWESTRVSRCSFAGAWLGQAKFFGTAFEQCVLRAAALQDAWLHDAVFLGCDLRGAHIEGMRLEGTVHVRWCGLHGVTGRARWGAIRDGRPVPGRAIFEAPDLSPGFDGSHVVEPTGVARAWGRP